MHAPKALFIILTLAFATYSSYAFGLTGLDMFTLHGWIMSMQA